jgi:hypothetical protein
MTTPRTVWQIASGPASRTYADVFLHHGVGLIGPGYTGPWIPGRPDDDYEGGFVRRLAGEVEPGDVFLLRKGMATICAIGLVCEGYQFFPQFDDVNGWDLNHGRRVRWSPLPEEFTFTGSIFGANPPRISRVRSQEVCEYVEKFLNSPPTNWQTAPLPPLPAEEQPLQDTEIPDRVRDLVVQVRDLYPLMWDRRQFPTHPSEDELIAHFTVPLLRALGWPPEHIAIKMNYTDVTLFRTLPRIPANCHLVIEAKRLGDGVEGALAQGVGYVQALGVPRDVVVTDGIRYRLYDCQKDFAPAAYANLANLKAPALDLFARIKRP